MSSAAAAIPQTITAVPQHVDRLQLETDWLEFLPARAQGTSWRVQQGVKRVLDLLLATIALIVLFPLLLLVALVVKLSSPGAIIYRYCALGCRAQPFTCYKFRTMVDGADTLKNHLLSQNEMQGPAFKLKNDPRVTAIGRLLRKSSIDELPQLWNVIRGDMSLVGPRQQPAEEFAGFERWQLAKLAVRPGITGLWQVSGRSDISDFSMWAQLDRQYIEAWNLGLDALILLRTVPAVISARGAY